MAGTTPTKVVECWSPSSWMICIAIFMSHGCETRLQIPSKWGSLVQNLAANNTKAVANIILDDAETAFAEKFSTCVEAECQNICKNANSTIRCKNGEMVSFSKLHEDKTEINGERLSWWPQMIGIDSSHEEMSKESPLTTSLLIAMSSNKANVKRNKWKKEHSLVPAMMAAINILLRCRNRNVDAFAKTQLEMGESFDRKLNEWIGLQSPSERVVTPVPDENKTLRSIANGKFATNVTFSKEQIKQKLKEKLCNKEHPLQQIQPTVQQSGELFTEETHQQQQAILVLAPEITDEIVNMMTFEILGYNVDIMNKARQQSRTNNKFRSSHVSFDSYKK
eukprot:gene10516-11620_t